MTPIECVQRLARRRAQWATIEGWQSVKGTVREYRLYRQALETLRANGQLTMRVEPNPRAGRPRQVWQSLLYEGPEAS